MMKQVGVGGGEQSHTGSHTSRQHSRSPAGTTKQKKTKKRAKSKKEQSK